VWSRSVEYSFSSQDTEYPEGKETKDEAIQITRRSNKVGPWAGGISAPALTVEASGKRKKKVGPIVGLQTANSTPRLD
jgi:hypothetical protein